MEEGPRPRDQDDQGRFGGRPIFLTFDELEALRLVDLEGLFQEDAAREIGVSRKTLGLDLRNARRKVVTALIHGLPIRIIGGSYVLRDDVTEDRFSGYEDSNEEREDR